MTDDDSHALKWSVRRLTHVQGASLAFLFRLRLLGRALIPAKLRLGLGRFVAYRALVARLPWEADVIAKLETFIKPGWTAIDVGGHVGVFTVELAQLVGPTGHVVVFEPHPDNLRAIEQRIARKHLEARVDAIQAAVSDGATSTVTLYEGRHASSAEWNIVGTDVAGKAGRPCIEVPAISLDSYIGEDDRVDFIKIDIEGAEHLALRGMVHTLARQRPALLIEFHPQTDYRECCYVLNGAGYCLFGLDGSTAPVYPSSPLSHVIAKPSTENY